MPEYGRDGDTRGWIVGADQKTFQWLGGLGAERWYKDIYRPMLDARAHPLQADQVEGGLFAAGKLTFTNAHAGDPRAHQLRIGDNWEYHPEDTLLCPVGPDGRQPQCHSSNMFMIGSQSKYPEEALRVVALVSGTEAGIWDIMRIGGTPVARHSVLSSEITLGINPALAIIDGLALAGTVEPYPMPWNFRYKELLDIFRNTWEPLMSGTKSWEEQAPIVQEENQKLMDKDRP